ncbi:MAG: hypothetical protein IPK07_21095 [Deltaproteobacteria bacterium]|nr:hypothetical protein [Deltaproteobacteria bacterium]
MSTSSSPWLRRAVTAMILCAPLAARAATPQATAYWDPGDPAPTGVIDGIYNGPTYAVQFKMSGDTTGVSSGSGNNLTYLFGYAKPTDGKKLSLWLTKGNNTPINIASAVPVDFTGKWSLSLNPAQAIVGPGGSITTTRLLICEYVTGTPGVNPYDKTTLYCGPWGPLSYSSDYDVKDAGLLLQKQNDGQDRILRGTLNTLRNSLWLCRSWIFDGPSAPQPGYSDTSTTMQDWGLNPPDHLVTAYQVDRTCAGNGGATYCDPSPSIKVNQSSEGQGDEFQWVYGGMFCAGINRSTIAMGAAYRDELSLYPVLFDGLFDNPITIEVQAGCGRVVETPTARLGTIGAMLAALVALPGLRRLVTRRASPSGSPRSP